MKVRVLLIFCLILHASPGSADTFTDALNRYLTTMQASYGPLLNTAEHTLISSFYSAKLADKVTVATAIGANLKETGSVLGEIRNRLATAMVDVDSITAGNEPSPLVYAEFRTLYFDTAKIEVLAAATSTAQKDVSMLGKMAMEDCSDTKLAVATQIFAPRKMFAGDAFELKVGPSIRLDGGSVSVGFGENGDVTTMSGQPGGGGLSGEETSYVGAAGTTATAIAAAAGAGSWAGPIGIAVSIVVFSIIAGLHNRERVRAISEKADILKKIEAIHYATIAQLEADYAGWVREECSKELTEFASSLGSTVDSEASFAGEILKALPELSGKLNGAYSILRDYLRKGVGADPAARVQLEMRKEISQLMSSWTTQENSAQRYWVEHVVPTLDAMRRGSNRRDLIGTSSSDLRSVLDGVTYGDCQFALCYPSWHENVPAGLDAQASWFWLGVREAGKVRN